MEKSFRRYQQSPEARQAFVEAEAVTHMAHQIRVLRTQRGWSQKDLASRLGTTQGAVSRLEDPSYGRLSFKTIVALSRVFDVAPVVRFMSTLELMRERWTVRREQLEVAPFEEEANTVAILPDKFRLMGGTRVFAFVSPVQQVGATGAPRAFSFSLRPEPVETHE